MLGLKHLKQITHFSNVLTLKKFELYYLDLEAKRQHDNMQLVYAGAQMIHIGAVKCSKLEFLLNINVIILS